MALTITRAEKPEVLDDMRDLVRAFFSWAMTIVGGTDNPSILAELEAGFAGLPGRFGPPTGCLRLARLDSAAAGCAGFSDQGGGTMEIKRMFVRPEASGRGVGAALLDALLGEARAIGYTRYILSKQRAFNAAQARYARPISVWYRLPRISPASSRAWMSAWK
jgi:GNAT superfamily N-acetyltransferase